jgi:hypothetical protein
VGRGISLAVPWTFVAVVVLVLLAAGGTYFFFLSSKPAAVAADYLDAVRNGNTEKRARLSSRSTSGQELLPAVILVAGYKVEAPVSVTGREAKVPASVELTVDPLVLGLERASLADAIMKFMQKHPVRADLVLVKEGLSWRVDQQQTQQEFMRVITRGLEPGIAMQLAAVLLGGARARPAPGPGAAGPAPAAPGAAALPKAAVPPAPGQGLAAPGRPAVPSSRGAVGVGRPGATAPSEAKSSAPKRGGLRRELPSETGEE